MLRRITTPSSLVVAGAALLTAPLVGLGDAAAAGPGGLSPIVESARLVGTGTSPDRLFIDPQVAIDPADPQTLVLADGNYRSGGCYVWASQDGGLTWSQSSNLLPPSLDYCLIRPDTEPQVAPAFAPDGSTLYVAMDGSAISTGGQHGPVSELIAKSTDLGATHSTVYVNHAQDLTANGNSAPAEDRSATIAIDPTDTSRIYVGTERNVDRGHGVSDSDIPEAALVSVSSDGGTTWKTVDINAKASGPRPYGAYTPVVQVGSDGTVYAVAEEQPNPSSSGSAFGQYLYTSTDHGSSWSVRRIVAPQPSADEPAFAIDRGSNTMYVAWDQQTHASNPTQNIFLTISRDGGKTWSNAQSVVDASIATKSDRYFPGISVAPNGRVDVAWYDFRNDPFNPSGTSEQFADVYYMYSTDNGHTWATPIRITTTSIDENLGVTFPDFAVETTAIASSNDAVSLAWPQPAASESGSQAEDDWYTRVRLTSDALPGSSQSSPAWAWGVIGAGAALAFSGIVLFVAARRRPARSEAPAATAGRGTTT